MSDTNEYKEKVLLIVLSSLKGNAGCLVHIAKYCATVHFDLGGDVKSHSVLVLLEINLGLQEVKLPLLT